MKITPLEIRQHEFEKIFRGYNTEEVDNFLANVSQEWERVLNESKMLRMQLEIAEKEAAKLREIEMTLFKTLKTAEDTSSKIAEQANQDAAKQLEEAHQKSEGILRESQEQASAIIKDAEDRATYIRQEVLSEVKNLEQDFNTMHTYKDNLLVQMKTLANATIDHVDRFESKFNNESIKSKFQEAVGLIELPEVEVSPKVEPIISETPTTDYLNNNQPIITPPIATKFSTENIAIVEDKSYAIAEETEEDFMPSDEEMEVPTVEAITEEIRTPSEEVIQKVEEITIPPIVEPIAEIATEVKETIRENIFEPIAAVIEPIKETVTEYVVEPVAEVIPETKSFFEERDDLKIIEGIGPKIADLLNAVGITSFRDLATTPAYKVKEILVEAGSSFASHDPTTWGEQAMLAASGNWTALKNLQDRLLGGRPEEAILETVITVPEPIVEKVENKEQITEEMLEKVNKVKAAIRKAMSEKADNQTKDNSPLVTLNDVIGKKGSGSFFDNL